MSRLWPRCYIIENIFTFPNVASRWWLAQPSCYVQYPSVQCSAMEKYLAKIWLEIAGRHYQILSLNIFSFLCSPSMHRGSIPLGARQSKTQTSCHQRHIEEERLATDFYKSSRPKYLHSKYQARIKPGWWETGDRRHGARAQNYKARNRADNLEIYTPIRRTIRFIGGAMQIMQWAGHDSGMYELQQLVAGGGLWLRSTRLDTDTGTGDWSPSHDAWLAMHTSREKLETMFYGSQVKPESVACNEGEVEACHSIETRVYWNIILHYTIDNRFLTMYNQSYHSQEQFGRALKLVQHILWNRYYIVLFTFWRSPFWI